jgi:hypothetical protein
MKRSMLNVQRHIANNVGDGEGEPILQNNVKNRVFTYLLPRIASIDDPRFKST